MFQFTIKDDAAAIDVVVTRALLALAALAVLVYHPENNKVISIAAGIMLLIASLFMKILLERYRVDKLILIAAAALLLAFATHSILFALLLLLYAIGIKFLYKQPVVLINAQGVQLKRMVGSKQYLWQDFTNIILKDGLLSLDMTSNSLLQLTIEDANATDETAFNQYCASLLAK